MTDGEMNISNISTDFDIIFTNETERKLLWKSDKSVSYAYASINLKLEYGCNSMNVYINNHHNPIKTLKIGDSITINDTSIKCIEISGYNKDNKKDQQYKCSGHISMEIKYCCGRIEESSNNIKICFVILLFILLYICLRSKNYHKSNNFYV